ncbi:hypothetical protein JZ751_012894 [Albula glossodonta]|uniref:RGS domain-containing protein n=1 Tax=Albula glossodonta TaxID=121402 RepID=A0A8T2MSB3_9TELE|nr:hypothetical protein JZ751_012894 [Albula glossodonta]
MRRFSSEGSLLDLDFLPWKRVDLRDQAYVRNRDSGTYKPHVEIREPDGNSQGADNGEVGLALPQKPPLTKEFSFSAEDITATQLERGGAGGAYLTVGAISDGCRAYSDSQLSPGGGTGSTESMGPDEGGARPPSFSSASVSSATAASRAHHHRQQARTRLTSAKLHLKNLFGQSPHSSHSNLNLEQRDIETSSREKKSRLPFLRQWSQVGHGSGSRLSREEMQRWGESLSTLLASRAGVSVFAAFLRSEFSEENLQFYLACEQYKHSSTNFSLQRRARDIYATYIQPGAPREVNLDSKTRDLTVELLQAPSHTSLSHAQKRILYLLESDCYPRFLQSPLYLSLLRTHE